MNFFKFFSKAMTSVPSTWQRHLRVEGIFLSQTSSPSNTGNTSAIASLGLAGYLTQLADDALAVQNVQGDYFVPWDEYYRAIQNPSYADLPTTLAMPTTTQLRPVLSSRNALVDSDFSIALGLWRTPDGRQVAPIYQGALLNVGSIQELMTADQWQLAQQVVAFAARTETHKVAHVQELAWGRIRKTALAAQADMSDFLIKTVVLTPERLDMAFRRSKAVVGDTVVEVIPGFDGAPAHWIEEFDRFTSAQDRYQFALPDGGLIQVVVSPQVKAVLQEIKRLPGRRVAGSRAQAFLLNPFATLGEAAAEVLDEKQFEQARTDAGLQFERFSAWVEHDAAGYPAKVGILVDSAPAVDAADTPFTRIVLFNEDELPQFITRLESAIHKSMQLAFWEGHELEILGDTEEQLALLKAALAQRLQPQTLVTYAQIHDLSGYSERIEGVGVDKPYYSPFIAKKKDDEGWFPDNVFPIVAYTPAGASEPVTVLVNDAALKQLQEATEKAAAAGQDMVELAWLPQPMPLADAQHIAKTFAEVFSDVKKGTFTPEKLPTSKPAARKTLVLRANIDTVDFDAQRRKALSLQTPTMYAPRSLNTAYPLLAHQRDGVARMQYLYGIREKYRVRGLVLGDDMGLGKTLQLLTLAASIFEREPNTAPMLVVAPVSLLENWQEEAEKFFPGALRVLTAYGDNLRPLRVPRESIDEKLRTEDGLVKFLKPGWVGNAQLVLSTYETLRDLEFSFALEKWSVMVCDEAQRIKNPAAMVTRAAKKQNASFKIACTGTPVENTLADLWCLFDFVQPGLLGALNDFGKRYRRPIEIDERDAEGLARVEELREKIQPQMLRRTKLEVIKDLPKKIIDNSCRRLAMSPTQRNFYARAIADFRKQRQEPEFRTPFKNHLGLLQYLRLVCTDPKQHGLTVFKPEPLEIYRKIAPKLDWLLLQLKAIQAKDEKVIVFCEFRAIQRLLQHYIFEAFGFKTDIINGDTSASSSSADSRQKRIKAFQAAPGFGVIVLSPVAVGFGVNIQGANHVVHYTRTWNPAKEEQASDRAWRIGQKKDVYIYYPVVAAEDFTTFDVKLDQLLERKRALAGDMLNGSPDISTAEFLIEDVIPQADAYALSESVTLEVAMRMEWRYFEGLAAALWLKQGFDTVYCTPGSGDNGVDVVAIGGNVGALVQVKTSANDSRALNWDTVKEVVTGEAFYQRRHPGISFAKVGLTNQCFNSQAHENAELNQVQLLERTQLEQLLQKYPVTMLEVERLLYAEPAGA